MTMSVAADSTTIMRQDPMTANDYMHAAVHDIDAMLGKGYAKAHQELVGAFMQTCALDFGTAVIARAIETAGTAIAFEIESADPESELNLKWKNSFAG